MFKYCLLLLSFLIFTGGCANEETSHAPIETLDYATVIEIKDAKTHEGKDANYLLHGKTALADWHAEIDIVFSQTPVALEMLNLYATHYIDHDENHLEDYYWEQTGNTVTIYLMFIGAALFQDRSDIPLTYEQAKERYPDTDWDNFTAYTIGFTLDWDTGRKRVEGIPIKPSQQILDRFRVPNE